MSDIWWEACYTQREKKTGKLKLCKAATVIILHYGVPAFIFPLLDLKGFICLFVLILLLESYIGSSWTYGLCMWPTVIYRCGVLWWASLPHDWDFKSPVVTELLACSLCSSHIHKKHISGVCSAAELLTLKEREQSMIGKLYQYYFHLGSQEISSILKKIVKLSFLSIGNNSTDCSNHWFLIGWFQGKTVSFWKTLYSKELSLHSLFHRNMKVVFVFCIVNVLASDTCTIAIDEAV